MRFILRLAPALLLFLICGPLTRLAAQDAAPAATLFEANRPSKYAISGTLRDAGTNTALAGVEIELRQTGSAALASTFTTAAGEFTFVGLAAGNYEISVNETGYEPADQQVSLDHSVMGVQVWLRKAKGARGESSAQTVSVRELSIPRKAHELMQKGLALLYQKSDYRGSITQFQKAIKEYPGYYEAFAQVGVAYMDLGDPADAAEALKKSIDVSGQRYKDAYFALAGIYLDEKRFADAEPFARKGVELDDASWKGHYELADALYGLNRGAEAEPEAAEAARIQPDGADTRLLLANIHLQLHKYPAVLEDLKAYLQLEPNSAVADQARQLQKQVQTAIEKEQAAQLASASADEDDDSAADDDGADPQ